MANKKIKKYWIRYNAKSDRLEEEVTEARFRPEGSGWKEVLIDKCCNVPLVATCTEEQRTFVSDVVIANDAYDGEFYLGATLLFSVTNGTSLQDVADQMNTALAGLAVFSVTDDNRLQAIVSGCGEGYIVIATGVAL